MENTLPETNIAPTMDGWNTTFLLGRPIFRGEPLVSGRVAVVFFVVHVYFFHLTNLKLPSYEGANVERKRAFFSGASQEVIM